MKRIRIESDGPRDRRGFALPAAILALVVVAVLLVGGMQLARQESRIGMSTERSSQAFYVAEAGMNQVLGTWTPPEAGMTTWGDPLFLNGASGPGTWAVSVTRVDAQSYFFVSTSAIPAGAGGAQASRQLGVLARIFTINLDPPAALLTRGTVRVAGSAQIRGADQTPSNWGADICAYPPEDLPGVVTDSDGNVELDGQGAVSGTPAWVRDPSLTEEDFTNFGGASWEDLVALATITHPPGGINTMGPSFNGDGSCQYSNILNWGDPLNPGSTCGNYFPIIHVPGNARIQSGGVGQGILLVDGDLDLRGGFQFYGIIIVQGSFNVQGGGAQGPRISGGVMARNADLETQSYVGSSIVQNSRCAVKRAVLNNSDLSRMRPIAERSWVDLTGISF